MTAAPPTDPVHDAERDAYLQGALRHAPDANLAPPAALSDAILRAARDAVAQAPSRSSSPAGFASILPHWLATGWGWLGQPRLAGALGGLMVATLVGVLWWGQPMERALEPVPQAEIRSNDSAAVPANPAPPAAIEPAAIEPAAIEPAAIEPTAIEPTATQSKLTQAARKLEAKAPATNEPAATKSGLNPAAPTLEAKAPVAISPAPAPARGESLAKAPAAAAAELERSTRLVGQAAPAQDSVAAAAGLAVPPTPALSARRAEAPALPRQRTDLSVAGAQTLTQPGPSAAAGSLADVRRAIAAQPERWTWRLGADTPRAMTNELQAWLARLDTAAGVGIDSAAPQTPSAAVTATQTLHLMRDSQLHSSLNWDDATLQMVRAGATQVSRRTGMTPQTARELDAALAQIAAR